MNKVPTKAIVGFFKVHLNRHVTSLPFLIPHGMNYILDNHNIVRDLPTQEKTRLFLSNQIRHKRLNSLEEFGEDLVINIAQSNGPKLGDVLQVGNLWNERD